MRGSRGEIINWTNRNNRRPRKEVSTLLFFKLNGLWPAQEIRPVI